MERKNYSAGAVKMSFWFMEFRKAVQLLAAGECFDNIKRRSEEENLFETSTPARAKQIYSTVTMRIKSLDNSFYSVFMESDLATQKVFNLASIMATDTLFFDFVYEVIREKMIIGSNEFADSDIRVFFRDKQQQDDNVALWTDATLERLGKSYKAFLFEAGITDNSKDVRKIFMPIFDPIAQHWLEDHGMDMIVKALLGVR